jgi:hypothetical protein
VNNKFSIQALCLLIVGATAVLGGVSAVAADPATSEQDKLFKEALYQREQGNLFTAIESFQTVLSNQPALNRARLELAVAYYRTLNFAEARRQAETVRDDPKTPENVRLAVLAFLAQLKADEEAFTARRSAWEPSLSVGLLYDSNVNAGPGVDVINTSSGPFTLTDASKPHSDWAVTLQVGLSHRYQSPEPVRVGEKAARFAWQSQLNYYRRNYFSQDAFNLDVLSASTGPAWFVLNNWRANVNAQVDYIRLGGDELATYYSLTPSVTWEFKGGEVTLDTLFQRRDFSRVEDVGRDADVTSIGLSAGKVIGDGKVAMQGGVRVFDERADNTIANPGRFSNDGSEVFVGVNWAAWDNGTVYGRVSQKDAKYKGDEPIFSVKRDETEQHFEIGFAHDFKGDTLKDWKLSGSVNHTENKSNVAIYQYRRDMVSVNLARSF